jgi:hypothetical protein
VTIHAAQSLLVGALKINDHAGLEKRKFIIHIAKS